MLMFHRGILNLFAFSLLLFFVLMQAIEEYGDVDVYTSNFRPLKATVSGLPDRVYMKMLVCANSGKVLGVHMCGDDSPEIIQVGGRIDNFLYFICFSCIWLSPFFSLSSFCLCFACVDNGEWEVEGMYGVCFF